MAPEMLRHYQNLTKPDQTDKVRGAIGFEQLKKQDVFQLGLILFELSCKIGTHMERNMRFTKLRRGQIIDHGTADCPLEPEHIEHQMIMAMTSEDPSQRPTVRQIAETWLRQWEK